ncbi:uncharacterized protein F4812DRAFT_415743 [Daldinia caldariorum]|uniref:uncharacterized protein n=1 Tax=Daldinia caldariorum TaxID=326644 RepID=UPI002008C8F2|nr:uncharacterized protein F4812DRAFT_415743 [Daldinia caldariorum]KAI1471843.1 hypothetical protein F4812DRAFT_415743 [Daldinia caldariorum]
MSDLSENQMSWFSEGGAEAVSQRIKAFFDRDNTFRWDGIVGSGANGSVYKVIYNEHGRLTTMAVKICHIDVDLGGNKSYDEEDEDEGEEVQQLLNEKLWLERLRNCHHIIQSLDVDDDPLANTPAGISPHRMQSWIFTEYIENGLLTRLVERHLEQYEGELFPCRLLWRFFMCLIRFCLEMAYWDAQREGRVDLETDTLESLRGSYPGFLAHKDLSRNNIAVGGLMPELQHPEHDTSPILKLLDFGTADTMDPRNPRSLDSFGRNGPQRNITDIGEVVQYLVLQQEGQIGQRTRVTVRGQSFETFAGSLHAARTSLIAQGIDAELINLIYYCRAVDQRRQLNLIDLAIAVRNQVRNRGHNSIERETNRAISLRIANITRNANTIQI